MEDKKLLKEFYLIADELDKNILRFNELENRLKEAEKFGDNKVIDELLKEYKEVSQNIKTLKERSKKLKENN